MLLQPSLFVQINFSDLYTKYGIWLEDVDQEEGRIENALRILLPTNGMQNRSVHYEEMKDAHFYGAMAAAAILNVRGKPVSRVSIGTMPPVQNVGPDRAAYNGNDFITLTSAPGMTWDKAPIKDILNPVQLYVNYWKKMVAGGHTPTPLVNLAKLQPDKDINILIGENEANGDDQFTASLRSVFQLANNFLAIDGGSVEFHRFENGTAFYKGEGSCGPCGNKKETLEKLVLKRIEGVKKRSEEAGIPNILAPVARLQSI